MDNRASVHIREACYKLCLWWIRSTSKQCMMNDWRASSLGGQGSRSGPPQTALGDNQRRHAQRPRWQKTALAPPQSASETANQRLLGGNGINPTITRMRARPAESRLFMSKVSSLQFMVRLRSGRCERRYWIGSRVRRGGQRQKEN